MSQHDALTVLQTPVTRRILVASGTKLAYTAPIVAASFRLTKLTALADEAVSGPDEITNRGILPPTIESVSFAAPSSVLITGRNLSSAAVKFETNDGSIDVSSDDKTRGSVIEV